VSAAPTVVVQSQMLRAAAAVAPRAVFISGNTATAAGLTVAVSREGGGREGDVAIEAGALVLADQGVCCIDEVRPRHAPPPPPTPPTPASLLLLLPPTTNIMSCRAVPCCQLDKIACDHHSLLEAMEQQRVSVAKSGVVTSLRRCTRSRPPHAQRGASL